MVQPIDLSLFQDKTRVFFYSAHSALSQCFLDILNFHQKDFDFILRDGNSSVSNQDFIIVESDHANIVKDFQPNIVFISTETGAENASLISENITSGGVLIYPENLENILENESTFFRKLTFANSKFQENNGGFQLSTALGNIPISFTEEQVLKNFSGLKIMCQQFGIMEEDFYEALMNVEQS